MSRRGPRRSLGLVSVNAVVRAGAPKPDLSTVDAVKQAMLNARAVAVRDAWRDAERDAYGKIDRAAWHCRRDEGPDHSSSGFGRRRRVGGRRRSRTRLLSEERGDQRGRSGAGWPLPAAIQLTTIYGAAVTSASDAPDAAKPFIAFMRDDANRAVWTRGGFDPPFTSPIGRGRIAKRSG